MTPQSTALLSALLLTCSFALAADQAGKPATAPKVTAPTPTIANTPPMTIVIACPAEMSSSGVIAPGGWEGAFVPTKLSNALIDQSQPNYIKCIYGGNGLLAKTVKPGSCKLAADQRSFSCVP
jgi:hypothetical protein